MKTKDIVTITSVALGTAALTVMLFWSASMEADNEGEKLAPKIAQPKLVSQGVELTLAAADGRTFQAGDEPEFELQAVNTGNEPAMIMFQVSMTGSSIAASESRLLTLPSMLMELPCKLVLKPKETKTMVVSSKTKLPANMLISVSLQETNPDQKQAGSKPSRIMALSFSTAPSTSQPTLASIL